MGMVYQAVTTGLAGRPRSKSCRPEVAQKKTPPPRLMFNEARAAARSRTRHRRIFDCGYTSQGIAYNGHGVPRRRVAADPHRSRALAGHPRCAAHRPPDRVGAAGGAQSAGRAATSQARQHHAGPDPGAPRGGRSNSSTLSSPSCRDAERRADADAQRHADGHPTYMARAVPRRQARHRSLRCLLAGVMLYQLIAGLPPFTGRGRWAS